MGSRYFSGMAPVSAHRRCRALHKATIIAVTTGRWRVLLPETIESAFSASLSCVSSDQDQVAGLKTAGYARPAEMVTEVAGAGR